GRSGRPGLLDILPQVAAAWANDRQKIEDSAEHITSAIQEALGRQAAGDALGPDVLDTAYNQLAGRFDEVHGGFGAAPKFPTPHNLTCPLREARRAGTETLVGKRALAMVEKTLRAMRHGGIYDHVCFGFHRYSTDERWLLPHFEKMLYDQALLAIAYTEAFALTRDRFYRQVAEEVFEYVRRDLTSPEGAFFSAEDADSLNPEGEKEEGAFYVWTWDDFMRALGQRNGTIWAALFNIERDGNVRDEATREKTGAN